jgi:hypothetical protein
MLCSSPVPMLVAGLTLAQGSAAPGAVPSGTAGAIYWTGLGIVGLVVLCIVVLKLRKRFLSEAAPENPALSLADTLRELRQRGEISPEAFARVSQRMVQKPTVRASPVNGARPMDDPRGPAGGSGPVGGGARRPPSVPGGAEPGRPPGSEPKKP